MNTQQKPKILCVCSMGINRSKYLAEYLRKKGYETRYGGIIPREYEHYTSNPLKKEDVEWANIIIFARKKHHPALKEKHNLRGKKLISLDVRDNKERVLQEHPEFKDMTQREFQKAWTYPQLEKAINPYLPFEEF